MAVALLLEPRERTVGAQKSCRWRGGAADSLASEQDQDAELYLRSSHLTAAIFEGLCARRAFAWFYGFPGHNGATAKRLKWAEEARLWTLTQ